MDHSPDSLPFEVNGLFRKRTESWVLRLGAADDGLTDDGHRFRRLALYAEESYILVSVDPANGEAWFKLYGKQELKAPSAEHGHTVPLTHSMVKLRLF